MSIKQISSKILKGAVIGALVVGNIAFEDQYIEDDNDFLSIAKSLATGWSWSINSAKACGDWSSNCMTIIGDPSLPPWHGYEPRPDPPCTEGCEDTENDHGGGTPPEEPEPDPNPSEEQCIEQAAVEFYKCREDVSSEYTSHIFQCGFVAPIPIDSIYNNCADFARAIRDEGFAKCDSDKQERIQSCKAP